MDLIESSKTVRRFNSHRNSCTYVHWFSSPLVAEFVKVQVLKHKDINPMEKLNNNIFMNIPLLIIADEIQDLLFQLQQHGSVPSREKKEE